jgi:ABC-type glycerol-3-phosphate transport system substrate-binding protein
MVKNFHTRFIHIACLCVLALCMCTCHHSEGKTRIRLLWFGSPTETDALRKIISAYEKDHAPCSVELQTVEWSNYDEKLLTMLVGRRSPDIARMSAQWCPRYAGYQVFSDIASYVSQEELADFDSSRLTSCQTDTMLYGLPHTSIGLMLFYNRDIAEKAGVKMPQTPEQAWTWDDFQQASIQMMERGGAKYGWTTYKGWFSFLIFVYQNGGHILKDNMTKPNFSSPACVEALRWFADQHKREIAPSSAWVSRGGGEELFMRGLVGMVITGNWRLTTFAERIKTFAWDVTYLPRQKRAATNIGGENLVVFKTPQTSLAVDFLRYVCNPENMRTFCSETLFIPTRHSLLDKNFEYSQQTERMRKFIIQSRAFDPEWAREQSTVKFSGIEIDLLKNIELVILGQKTPEEAFAEVDEKYRTYEVW